MSIYETIDHPLELFETLRSIKSNADRITHTSLQLADIAMRFSGVDRVPRYASGERESDVEHSYMLALVAPEIADMLKLPFDLGLISQYAIVHDLIELKTNDIATFIISDADLAAKHMNEQVEIHNLAAELPFHTASMLLAYESQVDPESRFVKMIDKLLPVIVDIIGQGDRVMYEDYDVYTSDDLATAHETLRIRMAIRFGEEFPAAVLAHEILTKMYEDVFTPHSENGGKEDE